jgi:hypothetical protein
MENVYVGAEKNGAMYEWSKVAGCRTDRQRPRMWETGCEEQLNAVVSRTTDYKL